MRLPPLSLMSSTFLPGRGNGYLLMIRFLPSPASPSSPEPTRNMVAGSGMGAGEISMSIFSKLALNDRCRQNLSCLKYFSKNHAQKRSPHKEKLYPDINLLCPSACHGTDKYEIFYHPPCVIAFHRWQEITQKGPCKPLLRSGQPTALRAGFLSPPLCVSCRDDAL